MNKELQITHNGTVVTYDENRNRWTFSLRGQDRSAESLTKAREAIDKPAPKSTKPFARITAWFIRYSSDPEKVEVTGIAEKSYGDRQYWIRSESGRSKEPGYNLFMADKKGDEICAQIAEKRAESDKLDAECDKLKRKLVPLKIEAEAEE